MKQVIAFLFVAFVAFLANGQRWGDYSINTEQVKIKEGDNVVTQNIISITNNTDDCLWLLFEPNTRRSDREMIREKFKRRDGDGHVSLSQALLDFETDWSFFTPELVKYFVKIIRPHKTFTIVTLGSEFSESIIKRLRLISQKKVMNISRPLVMIEDSHSPIVYKQDILVIP